MRIGYIVLATVAFALAGCKTTESAAVEDEHHVEVHVKKHVMKTGDGDGEKTIKIHIERDGEDPIHIEGDPDSPEVKAALDKLEADGVIMHKDHIVLSDDEDGTHGVFVMKMDDEDGAEHKVRKMIIKSDDEDGEHKVQKWVMKSSGDSDMTIDLEADVSIEGDKVIIKRGDKTEVIEIPKVSGDGEHKYEFIIKGDGDHKVIKEHSAKKVIVITGENDEEIKKKLEEFDIEVELEFSMEDEEAELEK